MLASVRATSWEVFVVLWMIQSAGEGKAVAQGTPESLPPSSETTVVGSPKAKEEPTATTGRSPPPARDAGASTRGSVRQDTKETATAVPAPSFRAEAHPRKARVGERVMVSLTVTNHGRTVLHVPNPLPGGTSLHLRLALPSGELRTVNVGDRPGGVWSHLGNIAVLPKKTETIRFDLRERGLLGAPGTYVVSLDYEWRTNEHWRSPELTVSVTER